GMTARNIRAHQTRGLLPAPQLRGRTGFYDAEHVARLELIKDMQASGFNLSAIKKLLDVAPLGAGEEVLRFERALMAPWDTEGPQILDHAALAAMLGGEVAPETLGRAEALGVVVDLGDGRYEVPSPGLLRVGSEVVALGIPVERVIEVFERLMNHSQGVAGVFVDLFLSDVWRPFESAGSPEREWPRVRHALEQLRPLASEALLGAFHRTMSKAVEEAFGERLQSSDGSRYSASP
ncbi:MAG: MerR family transcriptional regulator, partial [Actinomycetota bacterium]